MFGPDGGLFQECLDLLNLCGPGNIAQATSRTNSSTDEQLSACSRFLDRMMASSATDAFRQMLNPAEIAVFKGMFGLSEAPTRMLRLFQSIAT